MSAVPAAAPRETDHESGGYVKGVAIALVTQNKDPDGLCRVKVSYPWHSAPRDSYWARLAVPMAGKDRGTVFLPEVGDEVLVAFEREDVRFPYVIGSLWNGKELPPERNSDGKNDTRMIKSRKGHTITFIDGDDNYALSLKLSDGRELSLTKDAITMQDPKGNKLVLEDSGVTLEAASSLTLKAPTISVQASTSLELKGGASASLKAGTVMIN